MFYTCIKKQMRSLDKIPLIPHGYEHETYKKEWHRASEIPTGRRVNGKQEP